MPSQVPHILFVGLDEAILGGVGSSDEGDPEADAKRLAALLAHGAHGLLSAEAGAAIQEKDNQFQGEDIEQILQVREEDGVCVCVCG